MRTVRQSKLNYCFSLLSSSLDCIFVLTIFVAPEPEPKAVFGVSLTTSSSYASVAISLFNEKGESYIYGNVPIVVAKCGVFLKERGKDRITYSNGA
jgi:hypothetical protein